MAICPSLDARVADSCVMPPSRPMDAPVAMLKAVREVVHHNLKPKDALDLYQSLKAQGAR